MRINIDIYSQNKCCAFYFTFYGFPCMGQMDLQRVTFKTFEQICLLAANREEKNVNGMKSFTNKRIHCIVREYGIECLERAREWEWGTTWATLRELSLYLFSSLRFVASVIQFSITNIRRLSSHTRTETNQKSSRVECSLYNTRTQCNRDSAVATILQYQMLEMHAETIQVRAKMRKESIKSMLNKFVDSCILVQCQISNG